MAISLAEKLKKAAAARLAETVPAIKDRLDSMDAQALTADKHARPPEAIRTIDTVSETQQSNLTGEFDRQNQQ